MALNPDYILLPPLQNIFRDKDTGLPLRNGYILFFQDEQRTIGKEVFQLTGSPPNYTYITLGHLNLDGSWQVDLDQNGSISNGINSCNLYWFPFDANGNVQLYFVQIYSSTGVLQYSLEAEPNFTSNVIPESSAELVNFVPNGQFLWHTNIQGNGSNIPNGQIQQPITNIAYGGWTFERPSGSTAIDNVSFVRFGSWSANPVADPRFACRIVCTSASAGDAFKDLRLKFMNVNRFSSTTQNYTYGFSAISNSGSNLTVELILIKNFGTGGSSETQTPLGSITITPSENFYFLSFIFGDNSSKTIGTLDDDFIQIALRMPVEDIYDISVTDFLHQEGSFTLISPPLYPQTTNSQYTYRSVPGFLDLADYNSKDLYLPIILSKTGLTYDTNIIGKIFSTVLNSAGIGELMCDGSQYTYSLYSSDGIPFSRLGDKLWDSTNNFYKFGTGINFATTIQVNSATENLKLTNNNQGLVTNTSDGSIPTGFTFNTIKLGNTTYGFQGNRTSTGVLVKILSNGIPFSNASPGTSGFTVSTVRVSPFTNSLVAILNITSGVGLSGKYFLISNTTTSFYVWFKVDGSGTDPAPGGIGIEIDLLSIYTPVEVSQCIADALSGRQISNILCIGATSIPSGSFFNFNTPTNPYYVWYKKNGSGVDPVPAGRIGIEVDILSSDTANDVSLKTNIAINKKYYAVPDLRGMFLRSIDNGANVDRDVPSRFNIFSNSVGDEIGTIEFDDITNHSHTFSIYQNDGTTGDHEVASSSNPNFTGTYQTSYSGGFESRPINIYVNYVIKY